MSQLNDRDYTLIIDKSGSMSTADMPGGRSRWKAMQESALALAAKCETFDPDGLTLYLFAGKRKRFDNVTSSRISSIFEENDPAGSTDLAGVLDAAFQDYFARKASGKTKPNGEIILVVTDGEPDDQRAVMKSIIDASRRMERDSELGVTFIQIGKDAGAGRFLKLLDDQLQGAGAKFDIVDTVTMDDMEDMGLTDVLLGAINDLERRTEPDRVPRSTASREPGRATKQGPVGVGAPTPTKRLIEPLERRARLVERAARREVVGSALRLSPRIPVLLVDPRHVANILLERCPTISTSCWPR